MLFLLTNVLVNRCYSFLITAAPTVEMTRKRFIQMAISQQDSSCVQNLGIYTLHSAHCAPPSVVRTTAGTVNAV